MENKQFCFWLNQEYFEKLDTMIDKFSHLCYIANNVNEKDKYENICMELLNHKVKLLQILGIRELI